MNNIYAQLALIIGENTKEVYSELLTLVEQYKDRGHSEREAIQLAVKELGLNQFIVT